MSLLTPWRADPTVGLAVVTGLIGAVGSVGAAGQLYTSLESIFATLGTSGGYLDVIGGWSEKDHDVVIPEERGSMYSFWRGAGDSQIQVQVVRA